jgi:transposase
MAKKTKRNLEKKPEVRKITPEQAKSYIARLEAKIKDDDELVELFVLAMHGNLWFSTQLELGQLTIAKLRKLFKIQGSEKPSSRNPRRAKGHNSPDDHAAPNDKNENKKINNHGRNGADAYAGADIVDVDHPEFNPGDPCPDEICDGRLYDFSPGVALRITGGQLAQATRYNLQKLRCSVCDVIYTASLPEGVSDKKYDETFVSMLMINKYFMSVPLYRQDNLQKHLGVPLPSSTQWDLMAQHKEMLKRLYDVLLLRAANGIGICYDDTSVKILDEIKEKKLAAKGEKEQHNCFTTGIVSVHESYRVYIYMSDNRTAGKTVDDLLQRRDKDAQPPMLMSDALSANIPKTVSKDLYITCYCLVHARRQFYELPNGYDDLAETVIRLIGKIYDYEADTKGLDAQSRLEYHQENSTPIMAELKEYLEEQQDQFEPNGVAGAAIAYILNRFTELSQFLRHLNAPLDNNITERALKLVIQTRKSSMFYKTLESAAIASYIQSILYSAAQNNVNPYEYMTTLLKNESLVIEHPENWLPWNYHKNNSS